MRKNIILFIFLILCLFSPIKQNEKVNSTLPHSTYFAQIYHSEIDSKEDNLAISFRNDNFVGKIKLDFVYYAFHSAQPYYLADTSSHSQQKDIQVMTSKLTIQKNGENATLEIYFLKENFEKIFYIELIIDKVDFSKLVFDNFPTNEMQEKILISQSSITVFLENMQNSCEKDNSINPKKRSRLTDDVLQKFEYATRSDKEFKTYYYGDGAYNEDGKLKDDNIVKYIDKEAFRTIGLHNYLGLEWGFFLDTKEFDEGKNICVLFVYDIEVKKPNVVDSSAQVKIIPVMQARFHYVESRSVYWHVLNADPNLSSVVYFDTQIAGYNINNVRFSFTVENTQALNFNQPNYNAYEDEGDFLLQTRYGFLGQGKMTSRDSISASITSTILGYVPYIGTVVSALTDFSDIFKWAGVSAIKRTELSSVNADYESYINTLNPNSFRQIDEYGGLIKSAVLNLSDQKLINENNQPINQNAVLFSTENNNFILGTALFTSKQGYDLEKLNECRLFVGIGMDFSSDKSHFSFGDMFPTGNVEYLCTVNKTQDYGVYNRGGAKVELYSQKNASITMPKESKYFYFKPDITGNYTFFTKGDCDTTIELFDSNGDFITFDDDSGLFSNANIVAKLEKNITYTFVVSMYEPWDVGDFTVFIEYEIYGALFLDCEEKFDFTSNAFYTFVFTPLETRYYVIQTFGSDADTILYITDTQNALIEGGYGDDQVEADYSNINAYCKVYLFQKKSYYIRLALYGKVPILNLECSILVSY